MGKPIPKMVLIPRQVSLNHIVGRVIPAFETYGDVFQLVLPLPVKVFCFRKPDHLKEISFHKECGTMKPANTVPKADFFMGNGVYNDLGGAAWKAKRRVLSPAFTEASAMRLSERLPHSLERMDSRWHQNRTATPIELYSELQRLVLDYAAHALFSRKFDNQELDWIVDATSFSETMFTTLTPHWIPTPSNLKFRRIKTRFHAIMDGIIAERRKPGSSPQLDMLYPLLQSPNPATGNPHTDDEIKAQMFSAYLGTPAMALTILWGLFFLSTKPETLHKLREELALMLGDRAPRGEDLTQLPYLEMFVKEVLRTYPSFWGSLRYAKNPIEFDGYSFPENSYLAMIRFAAQRHPDHWERPNEFIPERHATRNACPHAFLPFGLGPRTCPGRAIATIICPLAIASIAQKWDVRMDSNQIKLKYGFGVYPANKMWATVRPVTVPAAALASASATC